MRAATAPPLAARCHAGHRRIEHRLQPRQARRHAWREGGLRDFFLYKDLGIEAATNGRVIAQLVKANMAPEKGTGWHRHEADFHIVLMLKGWARFMYEGTRDAGLGRRLRPPAARNRAFPVRLLAGHGVPRGRRPGEFHVDRHARAGRGARSDALAAPRRRPLDRGPAPQNSMSSSAMSSGSALAAASHSRISGIAMIVSQ